MRPNFSNSPEIIFMYRILASVFGERLCYCEDGEDCQRRRRRRRDDDSTKEPCDKDETTADVTDAPADDLELRRNLGRRGRRRGDATREPLADGETREPRQTREPRDATKEPCAVTFQKS